jgi:peptidoglycan/LPS O-acetylase OafA/YrhL
MTTATLEPTVRHAERETGAARLQVLDGWRAVSILFVLATHMLPLGPQRLQLNESAGLVGMALFFTLSGFLITSTLLKHSDVVAFAIRRFCRILPLAYVATVVYLLIQQCSWPYYVSHFLFLVNYDHAHMTEYTGHFWSLCVEVHFYLFVGLLIVVAPRRGLLFLPVFALAITALRIWAGQPVNIKTHFRVDEILSGATLALVWNDRLGSFGRAIARVLRLSPSLLLIALFAASCHPRSGPLLYARPYLASSLVGHTLLVDGVRWSWLRHRPLRYIAETSYALYVIHPLSMYGWLGSGSKVARYLKRPLCFAITFSLAHLSTFHMERHVIAWGKRLTHRLAHPVVRPVGDHSGV